MKKFCAVFAFFCVFFFVSCGGGSKTVNKNENPDTGDTVTDENSSDTGSTGTESGSDDSEPTENPDAGNSDTTSDSDNGDSAPDGGNTESDGDADSGDNPSEDRNPLNLPVCSKTSGTPCIYSQLLIWSAKSPERKRWIDAVDYCNNLNEGGFSDWRLPDLNVLATLIQNCNSNGSGCTGNSNGEYSVFGDITFFWSSYENGNSQAGGIYFYNASASSKNIDETFDVRCVRIETTSVNDKCGEIPENAVYNSVSNITRTWDWETYWTPSTETTYDEEASTTECRFKCKDEYHWENGTCVSDIRIVNCSVIPENAVYNSVSNITQTWDNETKSWLPDSLNIKTSLPLIVLKS